MVAAVAGEAATERRAGLTCEGSASAAVEGMAVDVPDAAAERLWSTIAQLASRENLPPGGTPTWSPDRRWSRVGEARKVRWKAAGGTSQFVDEPWHSSWEEDRQGVLREVRAMPPVVSACAAVPMRAWVCGWKCR